MINIQDLVHKYTIWKGQEEYKKTVLDGVSLDIPSGQFIAILGPNGSGKSTLAKHLNVLLLPDEGTVWIDGNSTADIEKLWDIRSSVGMVFQNPDNQIIGTSVEEDVAFGPENRNMSPEDIRKRVTDSLDAVGLTAKRSISPSRLSGGQKQRVAIAGVIADSPSHIVLDEPTAMLDPESRKSTIELVHKLNREHGITIILITHHMDEVVDADYIYLMEQGHVIGGGTPAQIFSNPELIRRVKMDLPQIVELRTALQKKGIAIPDTVMHANELIECLKEYRYKEIKALAPKSHKNHNNVVMSLEDVSFTYNPGTANELKVLDNINIDVREGEFLALIGTSGAGKTTLLKHFNGLLKATSGCVVFRGEDILAKNSKLSDLRKRVGMVFQYPEHQLFGRTVYADVCFGPKNMKMDPETIERAAKDSLALVGIGEDLYDVSPLELSGGQKRCVAIAGILAMEPEVLILDEPAAGLDPETKHKMFDIIQNIQRERGISIILVSHHMEDVARYADRVAILDKGSIVKLDTPEVIFNQIDELASIGIDVPEITKACRLMVEAGIPIPELAVTVDDAAEMLTSMIDAGEVR